MNFNTGDNVSFKQNHLISFEDNSLHYLFTASDYNWVVTSTDNLKDDFLWIQDRTKTIPSFKERKTNLVLES